MDATAKRRWYRLHWGTVLTVFFVGLGWLGNGFGDAISDLVSRDPEILPLADQGWPFPCIRFEEDGVSDVHSVALAIDIGVMLGCLLAVAVVVERMESCRFQFSLATLVAAMTAVAAVLAFWQWNDRQEVHAAELGLRAYNRIELYFWESIIPTLWGIGCTIYLALRITLRAATWPLARLRRPAPAKVEAEGGPRH